MWPSRLKDRLEAPKKRQILGQLYRYSKTRAPNLRQRRTHRDNQGGTADSNRKGGEMGLCEGKPQDEDAMAQAAHRFRGRSCIQGGKKVVPRGARALRRTWRRLPGAKRPGAQQMRP